MFSNQPIVGPGLGPGAPKRRRKWLRRLLIALGVCALVAAVLLAVLYRHIRPEALKERILSESSRLLPGRLEFSKVSLSPLPIPRVFIHNVHWQLPERVTLKVDYLIVTPRLLPLLMGKVEIARVRVEHPTLQWIEPAPEQPAAAPETGQSPPLDWEQLSAAVGRLPAAMAVAVGGWVTTTPPMKVAVNHGEIIILPGSGGEPLLQLFGLRARMLLSPSWLQADLSVMSNRGKELTLESWLNPRDLTGEARLNLHRFQLHRLFPLLFPQIPAHFTESGISGQASCELNGPQSWSGCFQGTLPDMSLTVHDRALQLEGARIAASFRSDGARLLISLDDLELESPRLRTSASIFLEPASPQVQVGLQAWNIDVPAVRQIALELLASSPTTKKVFTIVQGGTVPWLTWHAQAPTLAALDAAASHIVTGSMEHGAILVPGIDLPVHEARGQVIINGGTLYGTELAGQSEGSRGTDGTLMVGLGGGDAPFHLDIDVDADLKELHKILEREVPGKAFHAEMTRITEVQGRASGRMVLGESTDSIEAQVEVRDFNLVGRYQRIPYPVAIDQGRFRFRDDWVAVEELGGRLGSSTFSGFSAWIGWEWQTFLKVFSLSGKVSLPETHSWLMSYPALKAALPEVSAVQGHLAVAGLDLAAPLTGPDPWQFRMTGQLEQVSLQAARLPGPLSTDRAAVVASHDLVSLSNGRVHLLDGSLEGMAAIRGYLGANPNVEFTGQGELGAESTRWIEGGLGLPAALWLRAPLRLTGARSSWERTDRFHFSGNLTPPKGPEVTLDMSYAPGEINLKQLTIRGSGTDASLALTLNHGGADLTYRGILQRRALDQLLQSNTLLDGRISGEGRGHLDYRRDVPATAQGALNLEGLTIPWFTPAPVRIEKASLRGTGKDLLVDAATLKVANNTLEFTGSLGAVNSAYQLDLQARSGDLDWNSLERLWTKEGEQPAQRVPPEGKPWNLPLRGKIRLEAGGIRYEERLWQPLDATFTFHREQVDIDIARSGLCGIPVSGTIKRSAAGGRLDLQCDSKRQDLDHALNCLWQRKGMVEGTFNLDGWLSAQSRNHLLPEQSHGHLRFQARKGRIFKFNVLAKILAVLNFTEVLRGKLPDLARDGFAYETISAYGDIRDGHVQLTRAVIDGSAMKIIAHGDVDLLHGQLDLTVVVAPLKTADALFSNIPLVGRMITGKDGALLSFPFSVKGDIKDPEISGLSPSTVDSGFLDQFTGNGG